MTRVLVTGSHGFVGTHLRRALRARGWPVTGLGIEAGVPGEGEEYAHVDLESELGVRAVSEADPDIVFHLAAQFGRGGEEAARRALAGNVQGVLNLFRALLDRGRPVRVLVVGSSAQYGVGPPPGQPVEETAPQIPLGEYGWSKIAAEAIALAHQGRRGIEVIAARPFNHTGPGEPGHLVCSAFARRIARIEAGAEPRLAVGNLTSTRDFTDVRDIVRGYVDLAERGTPGSAYNVCSGRETRVEDVLRMLLDKSQTSIEVRADPEKERPAELHRQVGSFARAERDVGWRPQIPLEESLTELLREWREKERRS